MSLRFVQTGDMQFVRACFNAELSDADIAKEDSERTQDLLGTQQQCRRPLTRC
jgi:hypothetical protein